PQPRLATAKQNVLRTIMAPSSSTPEHFLALAIELFERLTVGHRILQLCGGLLRLQELGVGFLRLLLQLVTERIGSLPVDRIESALGQLLAQSLQLFLRLLLDGRLLRSGVELLGELLDAACGARVHRALGRARKWDPQDNAEKHETEP